MPLQLYDSDAQVNVVDEFEIVISFYDPDLEEDCILILTMDEVEQLYEFSKNELR